MPFNKNFTPGHEYMGTVVALGPGVDEYKIGQRVTVEIHAGCGQCKRCREGMYTACHNYGLNYGDVDKGHRANGFTTDGGFCEYQVNNINTLVAIPDEMSDEEATLVVTAGTAMYGLTELGGLVAGESVVVTGPGPIGLLGVAVAKALGAQPVILTGTRDNRLKIGLELGADHVVNVAQGEMRSRRCASSTAARASTTWSNARARRMPSTRRSAWSIAAARSASRPSRTRRRRSMSRTSCATTSTSTASAARARARRTAPRPSCAEALRRHQDPHPHLPARRSADRDPLRPGARRRRHQGGGEGARRRGAEGGGGVARCSLSAAAEPSARCRRGHPLRG